MTRQAGVRCAGYTLDIDCWENIPAGAFFCGSSDPAAPSGCWREYYRQLVDPLFARRREAATDDSMGNELAASLGL